MSEQRSIDVAMLLSDQAQMTSTEIDRVLQLADDLIKGCCVMPAFVIDQSVDSATALLQDRRILSLPIPKPIAKKQPPPPTGDNRTTMMLKNIPNKYTRGMLIKQLESKLSPHSFDFVYMPIDFKSRCNFGYCFINLSFPSVVKTFLAEFVGFRLPEIRTNKVCEVVYARVQGLQANVNRLINSPILAACSASVPAGEDDAALPLVFVRGEVLNFRQVLASASLRDNRMLNWAPPSPRHNTPSTSNTTTSTPAGGDDVYYEDETERLIREVMILLDGSSLS